MILPPMVSVLCSSRPSKLKQCCHAALDQKEIKTCIGPALLSFFQQRALQKRKISQVVLNTKFFILICNAVSMFTFYAVPSGGKIKDTLVRPFLGCLYCFGTSYIQKEPSSPGYKRASWLCCHQRPTFFILMLVSQLILAGNIWVQN